MPFALPPWAFLTMLLGLIALIAGSIGGVVALFRTGIQEEADFTGTLPIYELPTEEDLAAGKPHAPPADPDTVQARDELNRWVQQQRWKPGEPPEGPPAT